MHGNHFTRIQFQGIALSLDFGLEEVDELFLRYLASAGKDGVIKIWDTVNFCAKLSLTGHTASVTCIRWGGEGLIYSGSQVIFNILMFSDPYSMKLLTYFTDAKR